MTKAYRIFAYLIAFEVMVQATAIAWGMFGFGKWIDEGNVFNKAKLEDRESFDFFSERGFMIHGLNGAMIIPLLSLILLILAFFAKEIPGAVKWAAILFGLVIVQSQVLPALGREAPIFGAVHGLNALLVFAVAVMAGKRVSTATRSAEPEPVGTAP